MSSVIKCRILFFTSMRIGIVVCVKCKSGSSHVVDLIKNDNIE
jgi:hypothetical protein